MNCGRQSLHKQKNTAAIVAIAAVSCFFQFAGELVAGTDGAGQAAVVGSVILVPQRLAHSDSLGKHI